MIKYKSGEEIRIMIEGGKRLKKVMSDLRRQVKSGMTTKQIDQIANNLIKKAGGEASFKTVKNYHWATCLSINNQVVHTPPTARILKEGDLLTIDIGVYYQGFHTDYAETFSIGQANDKQSEKFLQVGRETLIKAINQFKENNHLGQLSQAIEKGIRGHGYSVIKQLTGHGIGKRLHEDPYILGYLDRPINQTLIIKKGLVVAIEVIYAQGGENVNLEKDPWSLATEDGSLAACFEHTVAITNQGSLILT